MWRIKKTLALFYPLSFNPVTIQQGLMTELFKETVNLFLIQHHYYLISNRKMKTIYSLYLP
jgi:hypothetical protein